MGAAEEFSLLILAGGRSRRMGQDKIWLDLGGQPLVERVARRVLPLAGEVIFSTGAADGFGPLAGKLRLPVQLVADEYLGAGPLAGLCAGLAAAHYDLVFALAADMPFVNLALIDYMRGLAADFDAVVPLLPRSGTAGLLREPLHAFYRRACRPAIARHLAAGHYQAFCFLPEVRTRYVLQAEIVAFDPHHLSFFNINTPDDWRVGLQIAGDITASERAKAGG